MTSFEFLLQNQSFVGFNRGDFDKNESKTGKARF